MKVICYLLFVICYLLFIIYYFEPIKTFFIIIFSMYSKIIGGKSKIDFTKFTLLGIVTRIGGCQPPNITNSVYYNKTQNLYEYK